MKLITNKQVTELISVAESIDAMRQAFRFASRGAHQTRVRTGAGGVTLSCMGAVIPDKNIAGVKVYTTINGKFRFVIVLFSTVTGMPLATIEADSMTGLRTAAASALATDLLATSHARTLSVIGTGVQARAHIPALLQVRQFNQILVAGVDGVQEFGDEISAATGREVRTVDVNEAVEQADVLLTVTRATTPLFDGNLLKQGVFIAAVGASKATVRELDSTTISRADRLVVEWRYQAQQEAGDLLMCEPGLFEWANVLELGEIVDGSARVTRRDSDIIIYKAIGIGLEDIALAGLVYEKASAAFGWASTD